jgi:hypothetical protein
LTGERQGRVITIKDRTGQANINPIIIQTTGQETFQDSSTGPSSSGLVTLTDDGTGIPFSNIAVVYGSDLLYNRVVVTRLNGLPQTVEDTDSQNSYGISTLNFDGLLFNSDADALSLADSLLGTYSEPEYRFDYITIQMSELSTLQQNSLLNLELTNQVLIKFTPNGLGSQISRYAQITGIEHRIGIFIHEITFKFRTLAFAEFVLDDAVFGLLDTGRLGN